MNVWLLYRTDTHWTGDESDCLVGVFSSFQLAVNYARKDRLHEHNGRSGPIIPEPATPDAPYVRLNERYDLRRERVDPDAGAHVCTTATCLTPTAIG